MPKILLVDDSPAIRSFIKVLLSDHPYEFVEADDGERAYKLLRVVTIDVVVADINMPVLDGLSFVQKVRACSEAQLRRLPIILLTADTSPETQARAVEVGASFFLHKPVTGDKLRSIVRKAMRKPSSAPPSQARSGHRIRSSAVAGGSDLQATRKRR